MICKSSQHRRGACGTQLRKGQSMIEFTFGLIIVLFIFFGLVQAARWVVMEQAELRYDYDRSLITSDTNPQSQIRTYFHTPRETDMEYIVK